MNITECLLSEYEGYREIARIQNDIVIIQTLSEGPEGGWALESQFSLEQDHILALASAIKSYRDMVALQKQKEG